MTREKFQKYRAVQVSGLTNMFDVKNVEKLTGLEEEEILDIMENYDKYEEQFKD